MRKAGSSKATKRPKEESDYEDEAKEEENEEDDDEDDDDDVPLLARYALVYFYVSLLLELSGSL